MPAVIEFNWNPTAFYDEAVDMADEAMILTAIDVALYAKIDPPYETGRYQNSIKVTYPSYSGNDFDEASQGDLLSTDVEELRDDIQGHELIVGSFLPYSYQIQTEARNPGQRFNLLMAYEAKGGQSQFDYHLYLVQRKYGNK